MVIDLSFEVREVEVTIQAKIKDEKSKQCLEKLCDYIGFLRAKLLSQLLNGESENELKKDYIKKHGLLARQFNSLAAEVKGLISGTKELRKGNLKSKKAKLKTAKSEIKKLETKLAKLESDKKKSVEEKVEVRRNIQFILHQKKRRRASLEEKIKKLEEGRLSICLGSKKFFIAQFNLEENGYSDHEEWKKDWRKSRSNRMFFIGSKDERFGNQNCQLLGERLQVRVPRHLEEEIGRYIEIPVKFNYGEEIIAHALKNEQAISYRFVRKEKGWYVFLTTKRVIVETKSRKELGVIGVDVNKAHLAWAETNRHGNIVARGTEQTPLQDQRSDQVTATLGDAIKQIVEYAKKQEKPIAIEKLDFRNKKNSFEKNSRGYRRMLSNFAYSKFAQMIHSKAYREGVKIIEVRPEFTSVIGRYKFSRMYGISVHVAASLALARRAQKFAEGLPSKSAQSLAAHRNWHVWRRWRTLAKAVSNREKRVELEPRLCAFRRGSPPG